MYPPTPLRLGPVISSLFSRIPNPLDFFSSEEKVSRLANEMGLGQTASDSAKGFFSEAYSKFAKAAEQIPNPLPFSMSPMTLGITAVSLYLAYRYFRSSPGISNVNTNQNTVHIHIHSDEDVIQDKAGNISIGHSKNLRKKLDDLDFRLRELEQHVYETAPTA